MTKCFVRKCELFQELFGGFRIIHYLCGVNKTFSNYYSMNVDKVNLFIASKGDNFPSESIPLIRERLMNLSEDSELAVMAMDFTNPVLTIILSVFFGELGVDRFIIGDIGLGIGKLLTGGGCGVWWLIDLFLIMGATKKKNFEKLMLAIG